MRARPRQAWGFTALELDAAGLEAGQVALAAAEGLLPDGTAFQIL
ncbi:MAG: type VI secretion system baseplate subunit TssK, partial [Coriobacteriia bacterium]|nr:type VI secretion system baseplate subunit TssK [Coriobacteriia bacterium]